MDIAVKILLAALAIIGVGGLIVLGVIWLGHRAMQRQAAEMAEQAKRAGGPGGPTGPA
jgi:hypothetical protein